MIFHYQKRLVLLPIGNESYYKWKLLVPKMIRSTSERATSCLFRNGTFQDFFIGIHTSILVTSVCLSDRKHFCFRKSAQTHKIMRRVFLIKFTNLKRKDDSFSPHTPRENYISYFNYDFEWKISIYKGNKFGYFDFIWCAYILFWFL